ncbi:hypothetical protein FXB41_29885 [Bradyrhizobium canariense]|uniref:hypothetical protein n=1 Tax=Bradyrhizobium canariense TaxID=255045 RepID=UPI001CA56C28|nr:hypothetical protein [Bradyrhizobium canariense]MBW5438820.1 hypothetical protein [Bradyrhizobium canariense]
MAAMIGILRCARSGAVGLLLALAPASAQTGGQSASRLTIQGPGEQSGTAVVRDALGRPCLDIEAAARAHVVNHDIVDHVVSVKNNCTKTVKVKVCYLNADKCNAFDVQGYKRVDTVLGTMTKITAFRYSVFQK